MSSISSNPDQMVEQGSQMDQMYRYQRHIYDLSRKYYLLGRDRLLDTLLVQPGEHVLEVGCGTARNLITLANRYPEAHFFGVDISQEMLTTARRKIIGADVDHQIVVKCSAAEDFHFHRTFSLLTPVDSIFFSYSLSMIPTWSESIQNALLNLKPGGTLFIIDFCDSSDLPPWFRKLLHTWLARFGVYFRPEVLEHLHLQQTQGLGTLSVEFLYRRYAYLASFRKSEKVK
ncbi:MAG TPA: class I SAM-dependent methyltransferase [Acidobacteriota bacterium]|nr:class I SAM-dependent methyltransferase [Acidobacteriota bacterium]HND19639.1 class I SAM-dependent methyltransferase [Acidobacteriota bacterium]